MQGKQLVMLRLVKPYTATAAAAAAATAPLPPHGPGERVLPFEVGVAQGVLEALAAAGAAGLSSEELQSRFHLSAKLMAQLLVTLKPAFKVRSDTESAPAGDAGRLSSEELQGRFHL